jgi:hypothetical protein
MEENMPNHRIDIQAFPPVAVVAPGIRKVAQGDTITFYNKTGGPVRILTAGDNVLKGVGSLSPKLISTGKNRKFTVEASQGTHELAAHYKYKDKKKDNRVRSGFAVGASSPKIVVVPPKKP